MRDAQRHYIKIRQLVFAPFPATVKKWLD